MSIRYITDGDEFEAKALFGVGRHHLHILRSLMQQDGIEQQQRSVIYEDGTVIRCLSCFGQDVVDIFVPPGKAAGEKRIAEIRCCWCTNWFTEGRIVEIYDEYSHVGDYEPGEYPDNCNFEDTALKNYEGIRYLVKCCQGTLDRISDYDSYTEIDEDRNKEAAYRDYVCIPSDFAEYEIDDRVIVYMRGQWNEAGNILEEPARENDVVCVSDTYGSCKACDGRMRAGREDNDADGSYLIVPLEVLGVNKRN